jgi:8-oxo-dGTP pyrophosphatase MutT (NUDIX family)
MSSGRGLGRVSTILFGAMATMDEIRRGFVGHAPKTDSEAAIGGASVAMILRDVDGMPEILFIERARREGDPWSGHMAFPGGRIEADEPAQRAAERETFEEVGISLDGARILGRLDDLRGRHAAAPDRGMVISAFVFHLEKPGPVKTNWEVEQAFWFPVPALLDPERHVEYPVMHRGKNSFPGILVGEPDRHVVWGLTYRFLEVFFEVVGDPLPNRWDDLEKRP